MKKTNFLLPLLTGIATLLLLLGCRNEIDLINNQKTLEQNLSIKNRTKIDFKSFKNETKLNDVSSTLKIKSKSMINGRSNVVFDVYKIDTVNINKLDFSQNKSYTFRVYHLFENPNNVYNLVYFFKNNKWEYSLVKLLDNHKNKILYDSRYGKVDEVENSQNAKTCIDTFTIYEFHCTCPSNWLECDQCDQCISISYKTIAHECGGVNGDINEPGNATNPGNGITPGGGGNGSTLSDPSGYVFDPNQPPSIEPEYVRANRAYSFWIQLNYDNQLFAYEHPDIYQNLIENYLNNYSTTNNNANLDFHNWGLQFFAQNPNASWSQFNNWFIDGNNLTTIEMQDFLSDLNNPNIVKPTKRLKNNILLNCIYNKAKTAPNFQQYLQNFYGNFSTAHLLLDVKPLTNTTANAQTSPPTAYWITITINSNNLNRPSLDIARTFMHEMIHAEMFRILLSLAPTSNGQIDVIELTNMLNSNNYPGIYDYFRRFGLNNMQHEQMAAHYRGIIKNYLKQIDNSITDSQADAMAWVGLQGTVAWNNLGTSGQNNILSIYNSWKNNATHSCP